MISRLINRLSAATCNFMAVALIKNELNNAGYTCLDEGEEWKIEPGGKYYLTRNDSAIFAFRVGSAHPADAGFRIIAAHSDSPCFKLKPSPEIVGEGGVISLNVEKYGGGIMYTWFDRPLSISGRVMLRGEDALHPVCRVIDLCRPVATIPHLAIHFNRAVNDGNPLSVQKDMKPVAGYFSPERLKYHEQRGGLVKSLVAEHLDVDPKEIIGMELSLYPFEKACRTGVHGEYLQSGRIDDLSMAFCALEALLDEDKKRDLPAHTDVMAIFDNEETGSATKQGAHAPVLRHAMQRICNALDGKKSDSFYRALAKSFLVSADDAHAWHPNYNEKYDPTNHPVIGGGPVVKVNANCKYMTDAYGQAVFASLCDEAGVKCQWFVNHGDVAGGSTLGNILTAQLDVAGVDMGAAIWAMHSATETAGVSDHEDITRVFRRFYYGY